MKIGKYIVLAVCIVCAGGLGLSGLYYGYDYNLTAIALFALAFSIIITALFDKHSQAILRVAFLISGLVAVILAALGLLLTETNMSLPTYCILLGVFEIAHSLLEIYEGIHCLKKKNFFGIGFILDGLFELVLGILMIVEREHGARDHINLIALDIFLDALIAFTNTLFVEKRELKA